jgi:hypothetical protein
VPANRLPVVRASQVPSRSFGTRCLLPPRRVHLSVCSIILLRQCWFRPLWGIDHSHCCLSRPISSSLSLRLAPLSRRGFGSTAYTAARSVDYMFLMLFYMADSFHSARTPKLRLAHLKQIPPNASRRCPPLKSSTPCSGLLLLRLIAPCSNVNCVSVLETKIAPKAHFSLQNGIQKIPGENRRTKANGPTETVTAIQLNNKLLITYYNEHQSHHHQW